MFTKLLQLKPWMVVYLKSYEGWLLLGNKGTSSSLMAPPATAWHGSISGDARHGAQLSIWNSSNQNDTFFRKWCRSVGNLEMQYLDSYERKSPQGGPQISGVTVFNHGLSNREIQLLPETHLLAIAHIGSAKTHFFERYLFCEKKLPFKRLFQKLSWMKFSFLLGTKTPIK